MRSFKGIAVNGPIGPLSSFSLWLWEPAEIAVEAQVMAHRVLFDKKCINTKREWLLW